MKAEEGGEVNDDEDLLTKLGMRDIPEDLREEVLHAAHAMKRIFGTPEEASEMRAEGRGLNVAQKAMLAQAMISEEAILMAKLTRRKALEKEALEKEALEEEVELTKRKDDI